MITTTNKDTKVNIDGTLLSIEEYEKYEDDIVPSEEFRNDSPYRWWLSTHGWNQNLASFVDYDGSVSGIGYYVDFNEFGVYPALKINIME